MNVVDEQRAIVKMQDWPVGARTDVKLVLGLTAVECFLRPSEILDETIYVVLIKAATHS
jgi:hypothetical protein